jgi:DNA-binding transcriptional LysR family regulator
MLKLDALLAFTSVAETGSITGAARRLALSKSVVSERLTELERVLEVRLVTRTTRTLALTADGKTFYERATHILREVAGAAATFAERGGGIAGPLRISAPVGFGSLHLGAALFGFLALNPKVELTLELDDRFVNILADGYDAVIRHGPVDDKRIIVKRLAASRRLLVASPAYLKRHGTPTSLEELAGHRGILYTNRGASDWRFRLGRKFVTVGPQVAMRINNGVLMRDAAIAGLGMALLPSFFLSAALDQRLLKAVDVGAEAEGATIYIAYSEHLRSSAKIRALTASLRESFGEPAYWDAGR